MAVIAGVATVVSTVEAAEAGPMLPATSVAVAVKEWLPGLSAGPPYVRVHAPDASAVAVPTAPAPTRVTLTELPASAAPVKTSEPVLAMSDRTGAAGGMRSIVTRNGGVV